MTEPLLFEQETSLSASLFTSVEELPVIWDDLNDERDIFLNRSFLSLLESHPPEGMHFRYVLLRNRDKPAGCFYFQWFPFRARESISPEQTEAPAGLIGRAGRRMKHWLAGRIKWNTLVMGNLLLTGEHHSVLDRSSITDGTLKRVLPTLFKHTIDSLASEGLTTDMILAKDFTRRYPWFPEDQKEGKDFFSFSVRPNMVVDLAPDWRDEASYLAEMQSKYRIRMRKARERKVPLETRTLDGAFLHQEESQMYQLYVNIADRAAFNLLYLHPRYFSALKNRLGSDVHFNGYFLHNRLIAFYSLIENGDDLVAHFVGFEPDLLDRHDLYLNMLLDMVVEGIRLEKNFLIFARTATEIKSSVGAVPQEMLCYAQHRNQLAHRAMPILLQYLQPDSEDNIRHPFKN